MDIRHIIKGKVKHDNISGAIFDEENNHIADARSWGRLQYLENGKEAHDYLSQFIVDAINEKVRNYHILSSSPESLKDKIVIVTGSEMMSLGRLPITEFREDILPIEIESKKEEKHFTRRFKK